MRGDSSDLDAESWLNWLSQSDVETWFTNKFGSEIWTTVYQSKPILETGKYLWVALAPSDQEASNLLSDLNWGRYTSIRPGLARTQEHIGGEESVEYRRFDSQYNIEPLVQHRTFPNHRRDYLELGEEFRLMFNFYGRAQGGKYYYIEEDGSETLVAKVLESKVEVLTDLVMRFAAAKQMRLLSCIESDIWTSMRRDVTTEEFPADRRECSEHLHSEYWSGKGDAERVYSRYLAIKMVDPPPIEACGLWPFESEKLYENFIVRPDGSDASIESTCDPARLASSFGKRRGEPFKLTPVFFEKQVLQRFYNDDERYIVGDGVVQHVRAWQVPIDNHLPDHVMVFLGDIGRDLPHAEQKKWKPYNVDPRDLIMSETAFKRSFLAEFAESSSPDHMFKFAYRELNKIWEAKYGWALYREFRQDYKYSLTTLRVLMTNSPGEFYNLVLSLARLLVDALNEKDLKRTSPTKTQNKRGLEYLESHLFSISFPQTAELLTLLRSIQGIRSSGVAHRKGSDFDLRKVDLDPDDLRDSFSQLLLKGAELLRALSDHLVSLEDAAS